MTETKTLVELKARLDEPELIRRRLKGKAKSEGVLRQRDTYFQVTRGRLKLRQVQGKPAQLVFYRRPDRTGVKVSQVHLVEVEDGVAMASLLAEALGVRVVVEKTREILRWIGVQVHLDQVEGLGSFLEFELSVEDRPEDLAEGRRRLEAMLVELGIPQEALLAPSYSDLLLAGGPKAPARPPRGGARTGR